LSDLIDARPRRLRVDRHIGAPDCEARQSGERKERIVWQQDSDGLASRHKGFNTAGEMKGGTLQFAIGQPRDLIDDSGLVAVTRYDLIETIDDRLLDPDIIELFERNVGRALMVERQVGARVPPSIVGNLVQHRQYRAFDRHIEPTFPK
jgi:hypothetical protein